MDAIAPRGRLSFPFCNPSPSRPDFLFSLATLSSSCHNATLETQFPSSPSVEISFDDLHLPSMPGGRADFEFVFFAIRNRKRRWFADTRIPTFGLRQSPGRGSSSLRERGIRRRHRQIPRIPEATAYLTGCFCGLGAQLSETQGCRKCRADGRAGNRPDKLASHACGPG